MYKADSWKYHCAQSILLLSSNDHKPKPGLEHIVILGPEKESYIPLQRHFLFLAYM